jgi:propionyl-CoA carboxylase beta chain
MVMGAARGMGVDLCYAWPISRFAIEASNQEYSDISRLGIEPDAYPGYLNRSREKVDVYEVARSWTSQVVDEVIAPSETRNRIIEALALSRNKREELPQRAKYHGTGPT